MGMRSNAQDPGLIPPNGVAARPIIGFMLRFQGGGVGLLACSALIVACSDGSDDAADASVSTSSDSGSASQDSGGDDGGSAGIDCSDCPVCGDDQIRIVGTIDGAPVDLDVELYNYSHAALDATITVRIRDGNDFADTIQIQYDRYTPDIRGKSFEARGGLDLTLNASMSAGSCPADGRTSLVEFSQSGDGDAQFAITGFRTIPNGSTLLEACAGTPITGTVKGCWKSRF